MQGKKWSSFMIAMWIIAYLNLAENSTIQSNGNKQFLKKALGRKSISNDR